jgi:hypothetical protein
VHFSIPVRHIIALFSFTYWSGQEVLGLVHNLPPGISVLRIDFPPPQSSCVFLNLILSSKFMLLMVVCLRGLYLEYYLF